MNLYDWTHFASENILEAKNENETEFLLTFQSGS